jgi:hypothetical protein
MKYRFDSLRLASTRFDLVWTMYSSRTQKQYTHDHENLPLYTSVALPTSQNGSRDALSSWQDLTFP